MRFSLALMVCTMVTMTVLTGCTLHELTHPLDSVQEATFPSGPPVPIENPATRNLFYGEMPRDVAIEWVTSGHETEPQGAVASRLTQVESAARSQLEAKGYHVVSTSHVPQAAADSAVVKVQVDYETCPTREVGGRGYDHTVSVSFVQGDATLGAATCRWLNHEAGSIDGVVKTLATNAAAKIPAPAKAGAGA